MLSDFSLSRLMNIGLYSVIIGMSISVFVITWRHFCDIETGPYESGALAGMIMGLALGWA